MDLPARLGKYELLEYLGGGMSEVYRAQDTVLKRTVAVKILTRQGVADPDTRQRFLREAQVSSNISHPHIIRTYDYGEDQGRPFLVLEFLTGRTLKQALLQNLLYTLEAKTVAARQIAVALAHVHSLGIVHRDIKPDNIHIGEDGTAKLMDFGIAKTNDTQLTQAGFSLGTPHYMAPEQVMGKPVNEATDVYSFGVLLYEMFTGARPCAGDTVERIFYAILHEPLPPEPLERAGIPEHLRTLIQRSTDKNPATRTGSFHEVLSQLSEAESSPLPLAPRAASRNFRTPAMMAAAGLALVCAASLWLPKPSHALAAGQAARLSLPSGDMVLVPAGAFLFGQDKQTLTLHAFYIDRGEVTNEAYTAFCESTHHPLPATFPADRPGQPVVNITYDDAQAFAAWAGKRLPSEEEWERAARGTDGRLFPWGAAPDPRRANVADNPADPSQHLQSALSLRTGLSPTDTFHMVGNAAEWVHASHEPSVLALRVYAKILTPPPTASEVWQIAKGGSYRTPLSESSLSSWEPIPARYHRDDLGFRCVKDIR